MKFQVICTTNGLVPLGDDSYEEKRKLRVGQVYECEVKVLRNYPFLKKAFALLNAAWSLMNERQQAAWRSKEGFRNYLTVTAGHYDTYYNQRLQTFVELPRSWSFDKMDEAEFAALYERMKDVIFAVLGDSVTEEIFNKVLSNF